MRGGQKKEMKKKNLEECVSRVLPVSCFPESSVGGKTEKKTKTSFVWMEEDGRGDKRICSPGKKSHGEGKEKTGRTGCCCCCKKRWSSVREIRIRPSAAAADDKNLSMTNKKSFFFSFFSPFSLIGTTICLLALLLLLLIPYSHKKRKRGEPTRPFLVKKKENALFTECFKFPHKKRKNNFPCVVPLPDNRKRRDFFRLFPREGELGGRNNSGENYRGREKGGDGREGQTLHILLLLLPFSFLPRSVVRRRGPKIPTLPPLPSFPRIVILEKLRGWRKNKSVERNKRERGRRGGGEKCPF